MQEQLMEKCRWFALQVGITEIEEDPIIKYKIKKGETKFTMKTPADRDGNKRIKLQGVEEGESTSNNLNTAPYSPVTSRPKSNRQRPATSKSSTDLKLSDMFE